MLKNKEFLERETRQGIQKKQGKTGGLPGTKRGIGTAGTVFGNGSRNRPRLFNCAETQQQPPPHRNRQSRKPEPLHLQTVSELTRGHPDHCKIYSENILLCNSNKIFQDNNSQARFPCNSLKHKWIRVVILFWIMIKSTPENNFMQQKSKFSSERS